MKAGTSRRCLFLRPGQVRLSRCWLRFLGTLEDSDLMWPDGFTAPFAIDCAMNDDIFVEYVR